MIYHHPIGPFKPTRAFSILPSNLFCFHIISFVFIIITRNNKWLSGEARMVRVGGPGSDPRSQHISFSCYLSIDHVHHPVKRLPMPSTSNHGIHDQSDPTPPAMKDHGVRSGQHHMGSSVDWADQLLGQDIFNNTPQNYSSTQA